MCKNCVRSADGKRLTNFPDPADMRGAERWTILPPDKEFLDLQDYWAEGWESLLSQTLALFGVPRHMFPPFDSGGTSP